MPDEVAADDRSGPADAAAAMEIDRPAPGEEIVERDQDRRHLLGRRNGEVADRQPAVLDAFQARGILRQASLARLGEIDERVDAGRAELVDVAPSRVRTRRQLSGHDPAHSPIPALLLLTWNGVVAWIKI